MSAKKNGQEWREVCGSDKKGAMRCALLSIRRRWRQLICDALEPETLRLPSER